MADERPKFYAPPVVETALSVQFNGLPGYSTAHAGWFWKEYLAKLQGSPFGNWNQVVDAPRVEDQFERFGADDAWPAPFAMKLLPPSQSHRTQIIRSDREQLIQIQDSRFILNWKKQSGSYPKFRPLLEEFRILLHAFESFATDANFGTIQYNQWEIAYIDHLKKGEMWESARDWSKIFPGLSMPCARINHLLSAGDETVSADWRFSLAGQRGRMYISLRQLRISPSDQEVLSVTFVGRGPVTTSTTWEQGFEIAHEALNETFLAVTSPEAHERWNKRA